MNSQHFSTEVTNQACQMEHFLKSFGFISHYLSGKEPTESISEGEVHSKNKMKGDWTNLESITDKSLFLRGDTVAAWLSRAV